MSSSNFEAFWLAYPKKVGKAAALKKWEAKKLDDLGDLILVHVRKRAKDDKRWKDGFILDPATFLSQERWLDEYETIQYKARESSTPKPHVEAPFPQPCRWQAACNRILLLVIQQTGGVGSEKLSELVAAKVEMGRRLRNIYGEADAPAEKWREHSTQGFQWLLNKAKA